MSGMVVLYVTRDGHSRDLALEFAKLAGVEAKEIVDLVKRGGFFGFMRSGYQASTGKATPIKEPAVDLASARAIVLFQPVWASGVCPPLRSWLRAHKEGLAGRKLAVVASYKGSEAAPLKAKFEGEFGSLDAFAVIAERLGPAEKTAVLEGLLKELGN